MGFGIPEIVAPLIFRAVNDVQSIFFLSLFTSVTTAQGQRMLKLGVVGTPVSVAPGNWTLTSVSPPNAAVAPAGYYMMFVVVNWVPSYASWVKIAS